MASVLLETKNLTKIYQKSNRGIKNVNLKIVQGKFYGLIGPNGAGKTTLIKTLVGTYAAQKYAGIILLKNKLITSYHQKENKKIAYVPEKTIFPGWLKVIEYLKFLLIIDYPNPQKVKAQITKTASEFGWNYLLNRSLKTLSSGEAKKVLILQAFATNPQLVIMDEPNENLDPDTRIEVLKYCKAQTKQGMTIIISSHVLKEIENYIDQPIFIFDGQIKENVKESTKKYLSILVKEERQLMRFLKENNYQFSKKQQQIIVELKTPKIKVIILTWCLKNKLEIISFQEHQEDLLEIYNKFKGLKNEIKN